MVLTASQCDAPHMMSLSSTCKERECICRRVAPDYAADLSVPILDRGRNAKGREIGSSTMCRPNYNYLLLFIYRNILTFPVKPQRNFLKHTVLYSCFER